MCMCMGSSMWLCYVARVLWHLYLTLVRCRWRSTLWQRCRMTRPPTRLGRKCSQAIAQGRTWWMRTHGTPMLQVSGASCSPSQCTRASSGPPTWRDCALGRPSPSPTLSIAARTRRVQMHPSWQMRSITCVPPPPLTRFVGCV